MTFSGQITSRIELLHTRREQDIFRAQKLQELTDFYQGQAQNLTIKVDQEIEKDDLRTELPGKKRKHWQNGCTDSLGIWISQ